jgi:XTP/dITP diphosphohydrolase
VELATWLTSIGQPEWAVRNLFVLADDSGLEVDGLKGAPGVYSARFAALDSGKPGNSPDSENNAKLLNLLEKIPLEKRTARFRCVLALTPVEIKGGPVARKSDHGGSPVCFADEAELRTETFEGVCEGWIDFAPRGQGGFGYDPLFIPRGFKESFAEMGEGVKNQLSHRSRALAKLQARLKI